MHPLVDVMPSLPLAARLSDIPQVDAWWAAVAAEAGVPADVAQELRVCLHELLANIVLHGGPGVSTMIVEGSWSAGRIALTVEDDGVPFDPTPAPDRVVPDSLEGARIGGLGLVLVHRFAETSGYQRVNGRNRVTLGRKFAVPISTNDPDRRQGEAGRR
jgi:serine/threonine-protein kinase RsbW